VHLPTLAGDLGVDRPKLTGALRSLEQRGLVRVTHAERCSGTQLLRDGEELEIDFEAHRIRRNHELDKLEGMLEFAKAPACRWFALRVHFGDAPEGEGCGRCDACLRAGGAAGKPATLGAEAETIVRKALSCVARVGGGRTASLLARVLTGSRSKQIREQGYDQLSTYGLLADLSQPEVIELLEALVAAGCLRQEDVEAEVRGMRRRFKVLHMTELGARVMRRQEPEFEMIFPAIGVQARAASRAPRGPPASPASPASRSSTAEFRLISPIQSAIASLHSPVHRTVSPSTPSPRRHFAASSTGFAGRTTAAIRSRSDRTTRSRAGECRERR